MVGFIRGGMQRKAQDDFNTLLPVVDAVRIFREKLKLLCIAAVTQAHCQPRRILNLSEKPDEGKTSVINNTGREVAPESMQFGKTFPRILQDIWEEDPTIPHTSFET